jgi:hypothetical protein
MDFFSSGKIRSRGKTGQAAWIFIENYALGPLEHYHFEGMLGGCARIRTLDPLIKSQLLYQLSYTPIAEANSAA